MIIEYFRNPDHDLRPWCMILDGDRVTKHICDIPRCEGIGTNQLIYVAIKPDSCSIVLHFVKYQILNYMTLQYEGLRATMY